MAPLRADRARTRPNRREVLDPYTRFWGRNLRLERETGQEDDWEIRRGICPTTGKIHLNGRDNDDIQRTKPIPLAEGILGSNFSQGRPDWILYRRVVQGVQVSRPF